MGRTGIQEQVLDPKEIEHSQGTGPGIAPPAQTERLGGLRGIVAICASIAVIISATVGISDARMSRAAMIAGVCLVLWLTEAIPLYATTLLLWVAMAASLGPVDPKHFSLSRTLANAVNPVNALFFGGFVLSAAATRYGIDRYIAGWMVRASGGSRRMLLLAIMAGTAVLSMWMSNIAAGAMMIATLRPLFTGTDENLRFRTALLLGVAFAADFGGIGTPIGTGPNLIAIGAVADQQRITFLDWMVLGVPLAAVMVGLAFVLLMGMYRVSGRLAATTIPQQRLTRRGWCVVAIFFACVTAWLTEPLHGVPAALVAVAAAAILFGSRLLGIIDLRNIEWETLLLVAGGLTLGHLFEDSGLARAMAGAVAWDALPTVVVVLLLVLVCATLSALASNTAAAAMLVQIGLGVLPGAGTAVLVALGASMGVPFVISTPPNAMAYGQGGLRPRDLFVPGMILMLAGCALLALTGPTVLRILGMSVAAP